MACCFPFKSCFCGWVAPVAPNRMAANGERDSNDRNGVPRSFVVNGGCGAVKSLPTTELDARGRLKSVDNEVLGLQEPVDEYPEKVLEHWTSRSCSEEVLEEIHLRAPANSQVSLERGAKVKDQIERRNMLTRLRRLFVKERSQEEQETEELRKEKKAVIKYLKGKNLYNRRMTYEQMQDLKDIAERSFSEKQRNLQEIEMTEFKSEKIQKSDSAVESKSESVALMRPEGPLEKTDVPIYMPDIPCVQCNLNPIIVQAKMSIDKEIMKNKDAAAQWSKVSGEYSAPSEGQPIKGNPAAIGDVVAGQGEAIQLLKEDQEFLEPPSALLKDVSIKDAAPKDQSEEADDKCRQPSPPEIVKSYEDKKEYPPPFSCDTLKFTIQTNDHEIPLIPSSNIDTRWDSEESEEFSLPPPPEDELPWKPKDGDDEFPPPPSPECDNLYKSIIIPRSTEFKESELDKGEVSAEKGKDDTVQLPMQVKKLPLPLIPEKTWSWKHTITEMNVEPRVNTSKPPLPAKPQKPPRIAGFKLKPHVDWEDVDEIEPDPTHDQEKEEEQQKMDSAAESSGSSLANHSTPLPLCLQGLRWKFDQPYCRDRFQE